MEEVTKEPIKLAEKVEDAQIVDTIESLSKDYNRYCLGAGDLQYKIKCYQADLEATNLKLAEINKKAFELKQKETPNNG